MTMTELDGIIDTYLSRLDTALAPLSTSRRAQIVTEIAEHINEGRANLPTQSETEIRGLLERIGSPNDIAESAIADEVAPLGRRGTRRPLVATVAIVLAIVLVAGDLVAYWAESGSSTPSMPNVIGLQVKAAQRSLIAAGIAHWSLTSESSLEPAGIVFLTNAKVGATVKPGQSVNLVISSGPSAVPELVGLTQDEAAHRLRVLGLRLAIVREVGPHTAATVIGEQPGVGTRLEKQSWVQIAVSSATRPTPGTPPQVLLMPAKFAIAELRSFGFSVGVRYTTTPLHGLGRR